MSERLMEEVNVCGSSFKQIYETSPTSVFWLTEVLRQTLSKVDSRVSEGEPPVGV